MAGDDDLWGMLASVGGIAAALGLLYLSAWMSRVSDTVRRHEIERQQWLDSLTAARASGKTASSGERKAA